MKHTIDYSFNDVKQEANGIFMLGISDKKLKEKMTQLETNYLKAMHLYHNGGTGSACLFRVEIKDLLLLLLRLDCGDILADGRTKQSGTTSYVLDQLFSIYENTKPEELLEPFERAYLNQIPQVQNAIQLLNTLTILQDEIFSTVITIAEIHEKFPSNEFKFLSNKIESFRRMMVRAAIQYSYAEVNSERYGIPIFKMSEKKCYLSSLQSTLDLREYVAQAINEIALQIYEFDENGVCYRKRTITDDPRREQEYEAICKTHMRYSNSIPFSAKEYPEEQLADLKGTRERILDFMLKFLTPHETAQTVDGTENGTYSTISKQISNLQEYIREYFILSLRIKAKCAGIQTSFHNDEVITPDSFSRCERLHSLIKDFTIDDISFCAITDWEQNKEDVWECFKEEEYNLDDSFFDLMAKSWIQDYILQIECVKKIEKRYSTDISKKETILQKDCYLQDNLDEIENQIRGLIRNTVVLILRRNYSQEDTLKQYVAKIEGPPFPEELVRKTKGNLIKAFLKTNNYGSESLARYLKKLEQKFQL